MLKWWEQNGPPVYISVASYLGITKPGKTKSKTQTPKADSDENEKNLEALVGMFGGSSGVM